MTPTQIFLADLYIDYFNNYISIDVFSQSIGLNRADTINLIDMGRLQHDARVKSSYGIKDNE